MRHFLDFEKPIAELEGKVEELRKMSEPEGLSIAEDLAKLTDKVDRQLAGVWRPPMLEEIDALPRA